MKRIIAVGFVSMFMIQFLFSQNSKHVAGGQFTKLIEYNILMLDSVYNLKSKGDIEKLFFGDFNAPVEFYYSPAFHGASGFRLVRDSLNTACILEIKYISNYKEAIKKAEEEAKNSRHLIDIPAEALNSLSRNTIDLIWDYNSKKNVTKRYFEELPKHFVVENLSFSINNRFAKKLYEKMVSFIDDFEATGVPPTILDGYSVVFRTVVNDEVWSLMVHMPKGDALKMADLCIQIIMDARAGKVDEKEYMTVLDTFPFNKK